MATRSVLLLIFTIIGSNTHAGSWYSEIAFTDFNYQSPKKWSLFNEFPVSMEIDKKAEDSSFSLNAGYKFNSIFALEVGYINFNEYVSYASGKPSNYAMAALGRSYEYTIDKRDGFHLDGVFSKSVGKFSPYIQVGVLFPDRITPLAGMGVNWDYSPSIGLNLYWERYFNAAERRIKSSVFDAPESDIDSFNLAIRYTFN